MNKKIEDYLHLYLGCEMVCHPDFQPNKKERSLRGKGFCNLTADLLSDIHTNRLGYGTSYFEPILRPLSDMMVDEEIELCNICNLMTATNFKEALINNTKYSVGVGARYSFEITAFLLKQCFDLFNLIPEGLAIDKTTLKP